MTGRSFFLEKPLLGGLTFWQITTLRQKKVLLVLVCDEISSLENLSQPPRRGRGAVAFELRISVAGQVRRLKLSDAGFYQYSQQKAMRKQSHSKLR